MKNLLTEKTYRMKGELEFCHLDEESVPDSEPTNLDEENEFDQRLGDEPFPEVGIFKQPRSLLNNDQIMSSSPILGFVLPIEFI